MMGDDDKRGVALFYRAGPLCQALTDFNAEKRLTQRRGEERKRLNAKVQRGKERKEQRNNLTQRRGEAETQREERLNAKKQRSKEAKKREDLPSHSRKFHPIALTLFSAPLRLCVKFFSASPR
jgi:hypothetical protein